jgi:hypothetical protein
MGASKSKSNPSSSSSPLMTNEKEDGLLHLDEAEIDPRLLKDTSRVEIVHVERGMRSLGGVRHWAWFIKGPDFYSTLEYGDRGIVVGWYRCVPHLPNVRALNSIMGDANTIWYDGDYSIDLTYGHILAIATSLKPVFSRASYRVTSNNCRNFSMELAKRLGLKHRGSMCLVDHDIQI